MKNKNLVKAMHEYRQPVAVKKRIRLEDAVVDTKTLLEWEAHIEAEHKKLCEAFYEDTKETNTLENCMRMNIQDLQCLADHGMFADRFAELQRAKNRKGV